MVTCRPRVVSRDKAANATEPAGQIQHALFWGLLMSPQYIDPPNCPTGLFQEVAAEPAAWQVLVGLVTLGIYLPVTMTWVCGKFPPGSGTDPSTQPKPKPDDI